MILTKTCRVPALRNSVRTAAAPRSDASVRYVIDDTSRMMRAMLWKKRVPLGLCRRHMSAAPHNHDEESYQMGHHKHAKGGESHYSTDSPEPIRAMVANVDGCVGRVGVKGAHD